MSEHIDDGLVENKTGKSALQDLDGQESKVVTARGTEDGLVLRIDGKAEWNDILRDIELFLGGRKKFFEGGQVSLEWLDRLPTIEQSKHLETLLQSQYGIELVVKRKRPSRLALAAAGQVTLTTSAESQTTTDQQGWGASGKVMSSGQDGNTRPKRSGVTINLFDEIPPNANAQTLAEELEILNTRNENGLSSAALTSDDDLVPIPPSRPASPSASARDGGDSFSDGERGGKKFASRMAKMLGDDLFYEDDANAKVFFGTLRSGQRLETPFSLIVVGDVNPGADLVAGGDIIVFGGLRGTAHASAYDDDSFDRVIIALQMQPMQLRIGSVISRGSDEFVRGAEIARIENRRIIVEAFNAKSLPGAAAAKKLR